MGKRFLMGILVLAILSVSMVSVAQQQVYKVALVAPFTGSGSILGDYIRNAFVMAIEEINAKGGVRGRQIDYVIYDDAASPATSINVVNKAILNDKVDAMFGPN
ncbi:MAG: ABC transporter substrate-binding protein, partial [Bacillota bacterium]